VTLELSFTITDADPAYVEQRTGAELYMHLRAVPTIAAHRRDAVERAHALYINASSEDDHGALGLLVLQRAMLPVEDLGGLLYALEEPASFVRLTSYDISDLTRMFTRINADPSLLAHLFRIGSAEAIDAEPDLDDAQRAALKRLISLTALHVGVDVAAVVAFWEAAHDEAKKTMHGVGFMAGRHAVGEPGAGMISRQLPKRIPRPSAIPLTTTVDHLGRNVNTEVGVLDLTPPGVRRFVDAGLAAVRVIAILAAGQRYGIETNHKFTVPMFYSDRLGAEDQHALERLSAARDAGTGEDAQEQDT
jgi:hypothetical protein